MRRHAVRQDGAFPMKRLALGVALIGAAFALSTAAQAAATVIGGGLAEACANAAITGKSDRQFQELCTRPLEDELLAPRDRARSEARRGGKGEVSTVRPCGSPAQSKK